MPERFAGHREDWIKRAMDRRMMISPAFNYEQGQGFVPSGDSQRVVNYMEAKTGRRMDLRPANSVMAQEGKPIWGSGGGEAEYNKGVAYVDPIKGSSFVVAHEGMHATAPSALVVDRMAGASKPIDFMKTPRDSGQRMRLAHEIFAKNDLVEEAHAQGGATAVTRSLGLPGDPGFGHPLDYPASFADRGIGKYAEVEIGPPSAGERKEFRQIARGINPLIERVFRQGYGRMSEGEWR